jgi:hypothetical protein
MQVIPLQQLPFEFSRMQNVLFPAFIVMLESFLIAHAVLQEVKDVVLGNLLQVLDTINFLVVVDGAKSSFLAPHLLLLLCTLDDLGRPLIFARSLLALI